MTQLFSEIYGAYYGAVAEILAEATRGTLTRERMGEIIRARAFAESEAVIPAALTGEWRLLRGDLTTPVARPPETPLTTLELRWLKALTSDPRIKLFAPPADGLEGVEPLCPPDAVVRFDSCADGDPYDDEGYISRFRAIMTALREGRLLRLKFRDRHGARRRQIAAPERLEYSPKDDKFRLLALAATRRFTFNLSRLESADVLDKRPDFAAPPHEPRKETLTFELTDERNALERAMLHFADLEKETERAGEGTYIVRLKYLRDDETELLIRVMSFGPMIRVLSPDRFVALLRERIYRQIEIWGMTPEV